MALPVLPPHPAIPKPRLLERLMKPRKAKRSKYRNVRTNGYASKAEARYAAHLGLLKQAGKILDWLEQVPVMLPGRIRYVMDFAVIHCDGTVRFTEVKGMETRVWINKVKQLEELRPEIFKRLDIVR